jgi:hypothetical protein
LWERALDQRSVAGTCDREFGLIDFPTLPEKLPLIHTGSSGTCIHTGWKMTGFLQIGQILIVKCPVRTFPILADFLSTMWGGGGGVGSWVLDEISHFLQDNVLDKSLVSFFVLI